MKKKYTVITGASSGIGFSSAITFAENGKNIIIIARRKNKLEELKKIIKAKHNDIEVIIKTTDLSEISNAYSIYDELKKYHIETWINNAGIGNYNYVYKQDLSKIEKMINLNVKTLTVFSSLYTAQYKDIEGSTLINVSSAGGYTIVPTAIIYCACKFYVSSFTEGLYREIESNNNKLRVKLLAPAATRTEFGKVANDVQVYDYDSTFSNYHTSEEMAKFLYELYQSDKCVGHVSRENFEFTLSNPIFPYANNSKINQKL
ncbi:SDR family NAD(P)-dependent oxidoreductase [uncultured Ilyobacter sp.]|uniref:SDR family NAD(P)-dependent oxidoreductase n=1 Tax=uncultured Ilyobacter sp. TaxID=544433 RepID=UPI0029F5A67B|nr:SDR family NAD(P)-dependent oxidoreductase [uncultured Ilyobacter sp.]